jgi:hypothetical protein
MIPSKIRPAAALAATSFSAVALLAAGGLTAADRAAAQDQATQSYMARASYLGDLSFSSRSTTLLVGCYAATRGTFPSNCHAEGTFTITVTAATKQKLGLSSATVGKGILKPTALATSGGRELTIPAAVKPKLKAFFKKAQDKCGRCGYSPPVAGRISVSLTGPAGLPDEEISASAAIGIGTDRGPNTKNRQVLACTSNWYGSCEFDGYPPM